MPDPPANRELLQQIRALLQQGHLQAAEMSCRQLLASQPSVAAGWALLGAILLQTGQQVAAASALQTAVGLNPADAASWHHLSLALQQAGRLGEAEGCSRQSLAIASADPTFWLQLGNVLFAQERFGEAAAAFEQSLLSDPQNVTAWNNLASAQHVQKNWAEAQRGYESSLALAPDQFETRMKLADVLERMHRFSAAERVAQKLVDDFPTAAEAWSLLGRVQLSLAKHDQAGYALQRASDIQPSATTHSRLLQVLQYQDGAEPRRLLEEHQAWAHLHAAGSRSAAASVKRAHRLRLGFVSSDLGLSPVAHMVLPVLEALDKERSTLTCYFDSRVEDAVTPRFRQAADQWRVIFGASDEIVAEQIRRDEIDILIDLMGHAGNRLLVFAQRAAPLQITWFGYVGTTGMAAMDYLLADRFHVQPGEERHYVESILRMPHGYACYQGPDDSPDVGPLPACSKGHITFGCFNNPAKWSAGILDAWGEILRRVPTAHLMLKYYGLDDPETQERFQGEFAARRIAPSRLIFEGSSPHREFLRAYQRVDIALDTQPYSGGVTTCDALWMGVPVVTFPGNTFAGRHALSHLSNAGYPQFIAQNREQYIDLAVSWAGRLAELAILRAGLRDGMRQSPLCDAKTFAADFLKLLNDVYTPRSVLAI